MKKVLYVAVVAGIVTASGLAMSGFFGHSTGATNAAATAATIVGTPAYTPTPGFVYFPAQYTNAATTPEEHIQAF
ncbi:MAG: hypothetical protein ACM3SS_21070 [Rhodospirillaceae bacterium]